MRIVRWSSSMVVLLSLVAVGCSGGGDGDDEPPQLVLNSIAPQTGTVGTEVVLSGINFGATQATGQVLFDGAAATVVAWADTEITVTVPYDAFPGSRDVVVNRDAVSSAAQTFLVVLPKAVYVNSHESIDGVLTSAGVFALAIEPNGDLTPLPGSPYLIHDEFSDWGGDMQSIAIDAASRRLYTTGLNSVTAFDIDPTTGALAPAGGPLFIGVDLFATSVRLSADATKLWVGGCDTDAHIDLVNIASNGTLSEGTPSDIDPGACVDGIVEVGDWLYFGSESAELYTVDLSQSPPVVVGTAFTLAGGNSDGALRRGPDGRLYSLDWSGSSVVYQVDVNPTSGALATGLYPTGLALPFNGADALAFRDNRMFVGSYTTGGIVAFDITVADGTLTSVPGAAVVDTGAAWATTDVLHVDSAGEWLYALDQDLRQVRAYPLDASGIPGAVRVFTLSTSADVGAASLITTP